MSDLISRQAAIDAINEREWLTRDAKEILEEVLEQLPSAQPERKTGRWVVYKAPDTYHCGLVKCPFCGEEMIAESDEYNYCPNCGAKMDGGGDDT